MGAGDCPPLPVLSTFYNFSLIDQAYTHPMPHITSAPGSFCWIELTTTDQEALADSLKSGRLLAAYLDVTDPEPLPPEHPLWSISNCYITPHTGGGHFNEADRIVSHFVENLRRYEQNHDLLNRVF